MPSKTPDFPPCACTIAGSDSSGGAGIQADLRTFAVLGVHGASVITALTAQNTAGVLGIYPVAPEFVALQVEAVRQGLPVGAWKTGMLKDTGVIHAVAGSLPGGALLVVDPVMVATSGARLLAEDAVEALCTGILSRATIVTPNLPEAAVLAGVPPIRTRGEMETAARRILSLGPAAVLIKGGHLPGEDSPDLYLGPSGREDHAVVAVFLEGHRSPYSVHGSGCSFSAAVTACLARGTPLLAACREAKAFITVAIRTAVRTPDGQYIVNPGGAI